MNPTQNVMFSPHFYINLKIKLTEMYSVSKLVWMCHSSCQKYFFLSLWCLPDFLLHSSLTSWKKQLTMFLLSWICIFCYTDFAHFSLMLPGAWGGGLLGARTAHAVAWPFALRARRDFQLLVQQSQKRNCTCIAPSRNTRSFILLETTCTAYSCLPWSSPSTCRL